MYVWSNAGAKPLGPCGAWCLLNVRLEYTPTDSYISINQTLNYTVVYFLQSVMTPEWLWAPVSITIEVTTRVPNSHLTMCDSKSHLYTPAWRYYILACGSTHCSLLLSALDETGGLFHEVCRNRWGQSQPDRKKDRTLYSIRKVYTFFSF